MTEKEILQRIKTSYQQILGKKLVGIYVHGSIAFGCFNWNKSDIDFIVVISEKPSQQEKTALIQVLLELDKYCPTKGVEMSVVTENVCKNFVYPTPYELHFSNAHKENFKNDIVEYCQHMNGTDKDLAAHFTVIRKVGIPLYGKTVDEVFVEVPKDDYIDSIKYDIKNAEDEVNKNPVYIILNLCRALAYIKDKSVLSKKQGGEWGIKNLPEKYHRVIKDAYISYCGDGDFSYSTETVRNFVRYAMHQIFTK